MNKCRLAYKLAGVFEDFTSGALFSAIMTAWGAASIWDASEASGLDTEYLGNHSGDKIVSPLVYRLLQLSDSETLTQSNINTLAAVIVRRYAKQWEKLYAVYAAEYNPIENYSMIEELTDDIKETEYGHKNVRTDNLSEAKTGTETVAAGTETITDTDIYGFDSADASPSNKETISNDGEDTTTFNTTVANTGTQQDQESGTDKETRNYTLERSGNIGVTTSQQMLQSEIDLWQYDFLKIVYANIDEVLTISVY